MFNFIVWCLFLYIVVYLVVYLLNNEYLFVSFGLINLFKYRLDMPCVFSWLCFLTADVFLSTWKSTAEKDSRLETDLQMTWPSGSIPRWLVVPSRERITYPTKREVRKIIDSKCRLKGGYVSFEQDSYPSHDFTTSMHTLFARFMTLWRDM